MDGGVYNLGGGRAVSVSLLELTAHCRRMSGRELDITAIPETRPNDVACFVTDTAQIETATGWRPKRGVEETLEDIHRWLIDERTQLEPILGGTA